jgi:flagellar biosynthesis/type III secretory pathway protein FliH
MAKGMAKGIAEGLAEGRAKGLAEGQAKGLAEGQAKGKKEEALLIARNLLDILDAETIARKTGLAVEDVNRLKANR